MPPLAVAVVAVHPDRVASTRLRATQHRERLAADGIELRLWSFFDDRDLDAWFGASTKARVLVVLRALVRVPRVLGVVRGARVVVVQREALPFGPPLLELLARWRRRLVWDIDDSIWVEYGSPTAGRVPAWVRGPFGKYRWLCRHADEVWAGSEVLAEWCRAQGGNVVVVPTVVDVPDERPAGRRRRVVGWIGSHSTVPFVDEVLPAVAAVEPPPSAVVVGGVPAPVAGLDVDVRAWSPDTESATLDEIRVGLYPVDRTHPLAEGKCGLKATLYMSRGVPPVVTPTRTNAVIVRDGVEGLHAEGADEWTSSVARLLDDDDLWERCSRAAHRRALEELSVAAWAPRLAARLRRLAGAT